MVRGSVPDGSVVRFRRNLATSPQTESVPGNLLASLSGDDTNGRSPGSQFLAWIPPSQPTPVAELNPSKLLTVAGAATDLALITSHTVFPFHPLGGNRDRWTIQMAW